MEGNPEDDAAKASPAKPGKLDTLSKEDLIKFAKKQAIMLQKVKSKCGELTKECDDLEQKKQGQTDTENKRLTELQTELKELQTTHSELVGVYNAVQEQQAEAANKQQTLEDALNQAVTDKSKVEVNLKDEKEKCNALLKKNKELSERMECLEMKQETMTSTFHCLQEESQVMSKQNQELQEQIKVLTEARDQTLMSLKELKQQKASSSSNSEELKNVITELKAKKDDLQSEVETLQEKFKTELQQLDELKEHLAVLTKEKEDLQVCLKTSNDEQKLLDEKLVDMSEEVKQLKEYGESMKEERDNVQRLMQQREKQFDDVLKSKTELSENLNKITSEIDGVKEKWKREEEMRIESEGKVKEFEDFVASSKMENKKLVTECQELQSQCNLMRSEEDVTNSEEKEFELNLEATKKKNQELEKSLETLSQDNDVISKEHNELKCQFDQLLSEKAQFSEKQNKLEFELETFKEEQQKQEFEMKEEIVTLKRNLDELQEYLQKKDTELLEVSNKLKKSLEEISKAEETMLKITSEKEKLEVKLEKVCDSKDATDGELQNEITALRSGLEGKAGEIQSQREELEKLQAELDKMTTEMKRAEDAKAITESSNHELQVGHDKLVEELKVLGSECNSLQEQVSVCDALKQEKDELAESLSSSQEHVQRLVEQLKIIKKAHMDGMQKSFASVEEIKTLNTQRDEFKKEVECLQKQIDEIQKGKHEVEEELKVALIEKENVQDRIEKQLSAKTSGDNELVSEIQSAKMERDELKSKLEKKISEIDDISQELHTASEGLEHEQILVTDLQNQLERINIEIVEMKTADEEKDCKLYHVIEELTILKEVNADWEDKVQRLTEELVNVKSTFEESTSQQEAGNNQLSSDVGKVSSENNILKEKVSELENEKESLHSKVQELMELVTSATAANKKLQSDLDELQDKHDKVLEDKEAIGCYSEEVKTEQSVLVGKVDILQGEKNKLASNLERLKREAQGKINKWKTKVEDIAKEKQEIEGQVEGLISDRDCFHTKLEAMEVIQKKKDEDISVLQKSLKKVQDSLTEDSEKLNVMSSKHQLLETSRMETMNALKNLQLEKDQLYQDLQEALADQEHSINQHDLLRKDLHEAKSKVEKNEKKFIKASDKITELSELNQGLLQERDELNMKVENLKSDLKMTSEANEKVVEAYQTASANQGEGDLLKSQIEAAMRQVKGMQEKEKKLKSLAMKGKKEAESRKNEVLKLTEENGKLQSELTAYQSTHEKMKDRLSSGLQQAENYQSLQLEYEKLQDAVDAEKDQVETLTKQLEENQQDFKTLAEECSHMKEIKEEFRMKLEKSEKESKFLEKSLTEMKCMKMTVESDRDNERKRLEEQANELSEANSKIGSLEKTLAEQKERHDVTTTQLTKALEEASQNSMMDLEIADYERTVESLNLTIQEKESKAIDMTTEIARLEKRIESMQKELGATDNQRIQADERANKLKSILVKTKKDLAEAKKMENDQRSNEAAMQGQLEAMTQSQEELKVQIAGIMSENVKFQDQLKTSSNANVRTISRLENKISVLEDDLTTSRMEHMACQEEYEGYKTRVHTVLKQQKSREASHACLEEEREGKQRLEQMVQQLKEKLKETSDKFKSANEELEALQDEHDRLLQRHSDMVTDMQYKERVWKERVEKLRVESQCSLQEQTETIKEMSLQNESITQTFKDEFRRIQEEHGRTLRCLHEQIEGQENQMYRMQKEQQQQIQQQQQQQVSRPMKDSQDMMIAPRPEEREQGEGMEHPESEPSTLHTPSTPNTPIMPFAQLLSTSSEDRLSISESSTAEEDNLRQQLNTTLKRVEHFTEITNENEATILRLTEQAKVLKGEIRRLERNQQRENAISNLEYLKNIVIKFLTLPVGDERRQLIPVISTMLKLSADEKTKLQTIAEGEEGAAVPESTGWSGYLHRWSGGMA